MAIVGLFTVPCGEWRDGSTGPALRFVLEPKFRRPSGPGRANASCQPGNGRGRCDCWPHRGRAQPRRARWHTMTPFIRLEALAAPVMRANIDTDQIIRIDRLIEHPRGRLGPFCMESLRYLGDGSENPDFAPNKQRYHDAAILVARANFGCGSSREHAVWSLLDWGIRAVIAPSFGDIFYG